MRSPALAIGWEMYARHRWGLSLCTTIFLVGAALAQVLPEGAPRHVVADVTIPLFFFTYLYLLSVAVYAANTLGGKGAGLPPRLFVLPMRTSLLVAWPMFYGMAAAALLYLAMFYLILLPCSLVRSVEWWPALLLAAGVAAFQAVCWTLVSSPLLRLVVALFFLPSVLLIALLYSAVHQVKLSTDQAIVGLCAIIAAAYALAVFGVARDRRGERIPWARMLALPLLAVELLPSRQRLFASPAAAQRWLEVRRHAWPLPTFVGGFVAMLFWATALPLDADEVARVVMAVIAFPPLLAFFAGFGMGKTSFWARDLQLPSFIATRPLTTTALARAKLQAAALATLATWALVLLAAPLWTVLTGNVESVRALADLWFGKEPVWKLILLTPLALIGLLGLTWLQIVAGMCLSLTGRVAVVNGVTLLYLAIGILLVGLGIWNASHGDFFDTLLVVLWCLGGGLGLAKLAVTAWAWRRPECPRDGSAIGLGALWLAIVVCLLVPLYALVPPGPVPKQLLALYLVLALPLTRLTALPAAIGWNRHR